MVVPAQRFREQVRHLARRFTPVPLSGALATLRAGHKLPPRAVAVSVDDVGPDFLELAWPILEEFSVPVCLAVVPGFADPRAERERLFGIAHPRVRHDPTAARSLAKALDLPDLDYASCFDRLLPLDVERLRRGLVAIGIGPNPRGMLPGSIRIPVLGFEPLRKLAATGLVEIASHSMTHPALREIPERWVRWEMEASRAAVASTFGGCAGFFYPGGGVPDGSASRLVREAGYDYACVVVPELVSARSDFARLGRIAVDGTEGFSVFRLRAAGIPARLKRR